MVGSILSGINYTIFSAVFQVVMLAMLAVSCYCTDSKKGRHFACSLGAAPPNLFLNCEFRASPLDRRHRLCYNDLVAGCGTAW